MSSTASETVGDSVTLDLFIGEEDESADTKSAENKNEALCLRILSNQKTRFRFGGLQITVKSPAFEVGKIFNVTLDENNTIVGIDSFRDNSWENSPSDGSSRSPTPSPKMPSSRKISLVGALAPKPARIIINPSNESIPGNEELPILSAHIVVEEKDAAATSLKVRKEEIQRIFESLTLSGLGKPSNSPKVSIGVGTAAHDKDHLRLDTSGNLRRVKSWKK